MGVSFALVLYAGPDLVSEVLDRAYVALLDFPFESVQEEALEKLAERRPEPALVPMIRLFGVRGRLALQSSDAIAGFGVTAVPALAEAASHPNYRVRYWAVRTLGKIGRSARASARILAGVLRDPVAVVRHNALIALPEVDAQIAVEAISGFLSFKGAEPIGHILAIQILESLGTRAGRALPALERLLREGHSEEVKEFAVRAVRTLRHARES